MELYESSFLGMSCGMLILWKAGLLEANYRN